MIVTHSTVIPLYYVYSNPSVTGVHFTSGHCGENGFFLPSSFFGQRAVEVLKSSPLTVVQFVVAATRVIALKSPTRQRLVLWIIN